MSGQRIPILRVGSILLVSIQIDLDDTIVHRLQEDVLSELDRMPARGVVIDVSSLGILDTYTARAMAHTAQMARLLGAQTFLVGMQPAVAITLTDMGFSAVGFSTALNVDLALEALV